MNLYEFYQEYVGQYYDDLPRQYKKALGDAVTEEDIPDHQIEKLKQDNLKLKFKNLPHLTCNLKNLQSEQVKYGRLETSKELLELLEAYYYCKKHLQSYNMYRDYDTEKYQLLKELSRIKYLLHLFYDINNETLNKDYQVKNIDIIQEIKER